MQAGALDRRILIEQNNPTQDQFGGSENVWTEFAKVWARVSPVSGAEAIKSDQPSATVDTQFRIRKLSGLTESMRIVYNLKNYDIKSILEIGRNEGFHILARTSEGQNDG